MPRGTKAFNKQKEGDDHKVIPIMQHLTRLGYKVFREPTIENANFSTNNKVRRPDLKVEVKDPELPPFEVYLELDGNVHGNLVWPTENTMRRNGDYERTNRKYIIISEEDCKFHGIDVEKYAAIRIDEEFSKFKSRFFVGLIN